jgi:hypothetical protein
MQSPMSNVKNNVVLIANDGFTKWRRRLGRNTANTPTLLVNKLCSSYSHHWDKFEELKLWYSAMWRCTVRRVSTVAEEPPTSSFRVWRQRQLDPPYLPDYMVSRGTRQEPPIIAEKITNRTRLYPLFNKNQAAWNFLSPELEVTWRTVVIIIPVVLLSPYLCIRGVPLSSIHYNQSRRIYINQRHQYIRLIWS